MAEPIIPPDGVAAQSFFTPVAFADPARPPAILADDIDPLTGELRSILAGIHPVDAQVVTILRGRRNSGAALRRHGNTFGDITHVSDDIVDRVRNELDRSFEVMVKRGDIRIDDVVTEEAAGIGDGVNLFMAYTNLKTGKPEKAPIL